MRLDPRTKLLIIIVMTSLAIFAKDLVYLAIIFILILLFNLMMKTKVINAVKRLKHLISLIVFIALMQSLTVKEGIPLIIIGKINLITSGGLINGAEFALRMAIIIFASLIASTEEGRGMIDALISVKIPYELAFMVSVSIRFIPVFSEEFKSRLNAIRMRGIEIKRLSIIRKLKLYTYLLSPTIYSAVLKSRLLAKSMEARGFRAYPQRTALRVLRLKVADFVVIMILAATLALFIFASCTLGGIV